MTHITTAADLLTEVELALLSGRNLEQIEGEVLAGQELNEQSHEATWLDARSCADRFPAGERPRIRTAPPRPDGGASRVGEGQRDHPEEVWRPWPRLIRRQVSSTHRTEDRI